MGSEDFLQLREMGGTVSNLLVAWQYVKVICWGRRGGGGGLHANSLRSSSEHLYISIKLIVKVSLVRVMLSGVVWNGYWVRSAY